MLRTLPLLLTLCACAHTPYQPTAFAVQVKGQGPPVVFIPGAANGGEVWDGTVAHLSGKVQAHVVTLAGFAGQPAVTPADKPMLAEARTQLARYLRERRLKAVIVGHSLGAMMAWWLAAAEADVVKAVVAVDAPPYGMALEDPALTPTRFEPQAKQMRDGMRQMKPEQLASEAQARFGAMITDPAQVEKFAAAGAKSDARTLADALYELFTTDLRAAAGKIRVPTLTLIAKAGVPAERWAVYEAAFRAQVDQVPGNQTIVFEKSKHFIMLDAPEAFYRALDQFLAAQR